MEAIALDVCFFLFCGDHREISITQTVAVPPPPISSGSYFCHGAICCSSICSESPLLKTALGSYSYGLERRCIWKWAVQPSFAIGEFVQLASHEAGPRRPFQVERHRTSTKFVQ